MKLKLLNKESLIIALSFLVLSLFWIFFSDRLLLSLFTEPNRLTHFQTYKGVFYVIMATLYILYIVNREIDRKNRLIVLLNKKNEWQNLLISNIPDIEVILFDSTPLPILIQGNEFLSNTKNNDEKSLDEVLTFKNDTQLISFLSLKKDILSGNAVNLNFQNSHVNLIIKGRPVTDDNGKVIAGLLVYLNNKDKIELQEELLEEKEKYKQLFQEYHSVNVELKRSYQNLISKNESLQKSKELYQNFFIQSTYGIYRIDFDKPLKTSLSPEEQKKYIIENGFLAECNPVLAKIYGKNNPEDLLMVKISELHNIDTINIFFDLTKELVINDYRIQNVETQEILSGGIKHYYLNTMIGIIENEKLIRIWGTKTNITRLKKYESELLKAKKAAEESDKLKSAFLANMTHEVRTPLNGIVGFADLLSKNNLTQEQRNKYIRIVKASNNQLLRIIDDILDISRIDTGQLTISVYEFSLNKMMSDIGTYLNQEINRLEKQLEVKQICHFDDGNDLIKSDEARIYQVITNLINNSVKFTKTGKITFGYKLINPTTLEFFVSDTGIGIPKELHKSIFKQFQQGEDYMTKSYGGTGLGLAICEGILKLLHGEIKVESELDKGSTFTFTIPYLRSNKPS